MLRPRAATPSRNAHPTWLAACLLVLPFAASAQSLQELYNAARVYDASYLAARSLADSAQYRAAQADALLRPSAAMTASGTHTQTHTVTGRDVYTQNLQAGVSGRYPLFNKANEASITQARAALEVAAADLEAAEQDLIIRVVQAYFDVLASQDTLSTTQANKTGITEQLASAKRNFEVGTATITDTREAQAKFDLAVAQEIAAENDLRTKRIALDQLVGRSNVAPRPLAVPVGLPALGTQGAEDWVTRALDQHPSVRKARLAQDIARLEIDRAKAAERPTVDLVGSVTPSYSRGSAVIAAGGKNGVTTNAVMGVQMNWPLYTGGATTNRIKETVALEEKSRNDLEVARRAVAQATRVAFFGVQSGQAQVRALEAAESSSKLAVEATQLGYKVGVRVNLDVLNAQTQLFQTQAQLARARYDVIVGSLRLRQAAGQLAASDVNTINALVAK
ncbi:MAG: TolC family outer membrane protein [Aquabacterium sp.]